MAYITGLRKALTENELIKERIIDEIIQYQNPYRNNPKLFCEEHNKKNK